MFNEDEDYPQHQQRQPVLQPQPVIRSQPYVRIIEEPASRGVRFRYACEIKLAGSIPGVRSTLENKTYPTIQVVGFKGRAMAVVSCVTTDPPYKSHPHNLVGYGCVKGVCTLPIPTDTMTLEFKNLGIQYVRRADVDSSLHIRENIRVDPFRTGFGHRKQAHSIDLTAVRLCFQVFREGNTPGKYSVPFTPIVSQSICNRKYHSCLNIIKISDCVSYVDGGPKDIIILCGPISYLNIQVRFFDSDSDWEAYAELSANQIHGQSAVWFRPPTYRCLEIKEPVKVYVQLRRPSDGATGEPIRFELLPLRFGMTGQKRRRVMTNCILNNLGEPYPIHSEYSAEKETRDYISAVSRFPSLELSPEHMPSARVSPQCVSASRPSTSNIKCNIPKNNLIGSARNSVVPAVIPHAQNLLDNDEISIDADELDHILRTMDVNPTHLPEIGNVSLCDIIPY